MESSPYEIIPADLDRDRDQIMGVWSRNLLFRDPAVQAAKYDWFYFGNPVGKGRCWLLRHRPTQRIVGTAGLGLRRFCVGGSSLLVGLGCDLAVDKEHRLLQPAMMLQKGVLESLSGGVDFIYGLPNVKAAPVFQRLGYWYPSSLARFVKVLKTEKHLRLPKVLRTTAAMAADLALRGFSRETWMRDGESKVVELPSIGVEFDDLWQRARGQFPATCQRDAAFLQWRFKRCPLARYAILGLVSNSAQRLDGYAMCYVDDDGHAEIADFLAVDDDATDHLLAGVVRWARSRNASSIGCEFLNQVHFEGRLRRFGFIRRPQPLNVMVRFATAGPDSRQSELLKDWFFLPADQPNL